MKEVTWPGGAGPSSCPAPVVVSGGQLCVLLEGLHLLLVLLLELLRHSLQLQDELKRLAVDEVHVTELFRPVL